MANAELWAGALSLIVSYSETGCEKSGRQAACLLDRIVNMPELDPQSCALFERARLRLADQLSQGTAGCLQ